MKAQRRSFGLVFTAFIVLLAISAAALSLLHPAGVSYAPESRVATQPLARSSPVQPPPGGSPDWSTGVQKSIRESEYRVSWQSQTSLAGVPAAWQAANRAHNFRTYFTPEGPRTTPRTATNPDWTWGITLQAWGPTGNTQPVSKPDLSVSGNRIEYRREGLTEWYVNDETGIEQGFTLDAPPKTDAASELEGAGPARSPGFSRPNRRQAATGHVDHRPDRPAKAGTTNRQSSCAVETSWIELDLGLTGNLKAVLEPSGNSILMTRSDGAGIVEYGKLEAFDSRGQKLPTRLGLEDSRIALLVDIRDAVYPVTVDPLATSPAWTVESNQAGSDFGFSVATAGDVNGDGFSDVVVGAIYYDHGQANEGAAFLYLGSSGGLGSSAATMLESDQSGCYFGWSVSTAGDVNGDGFSDVIVGAKGYTHGESLEGRAFVYLGSEAGLNPVAAWTAESNQADANFGCSVATAGDVNGDGYSDVIVGAYLYTDGQAYEGRAYVYMGSPAGLYFLAVWAAESDQAGAYFGYSVATAGDVNGDGYSDVIVGAYLYDAGETNEGRAFIYFGSADGLSLSSPPLTLESDREYAWFGYSVGTAGDVNGDGYSDVIVDALYYTGDQSNEGAAFVYHGSASGISTTPALLLEADQANARFGNSVATAGDVNGDGFSDVIVGAHSYDSGEIDEGRAFFYLGSADGLSSAPAWTAEGNQAGSAFGCTTATAGDVNGDGFSDVIVGAVGYANGQASEGRVYLYLGSGSGPKTSPDWTGQVAQPTARFGNSVSTAGDVNGDGYSDIIVGAQWFDNGEEDEGRAFVFLGSATGLGLSPAWWVESNQPFARFGSMVSTAGDVNGDGYSDVIVAADLYDNDQTDEGCAFLYLGSATGPGSLPAWTAEGDQASASFGSSLGTAGDVNGDGCSDVIIGAKSYDNGQTDEGRAFLYLGSTAGLASLPAWTAESNQAGSSFGYSVASAGDVNRDGYSDVIVGAPRHNNGLPIEGRVFVYLGSAGGLGSSAAWTANCSQEAAMFGYSVSGAGDVDGDGFSDIIIGAPYYDNGHPNEGGVFLYLGSALGLGLTPAWTAESDLPQAAMGSAISTAGDVNGDGYSDVIINVPDYQHDSYQSGRALLYLGSASGLNASPAWTAEVVGPSAVVFAQSLATAGDVNGDGYSDVIIGSSRYYAGAATNGEVRLYYGNGAAGISVNARQQSPDATPVDHFGLSGSASGFRVTSLARTAYGRGKVKLQWEAKPLGTAFNGLGTGKSASWVDSQVAGVELAEAVTVPYTGPYHWRARVVYHQATTPFQLFGRWMSPFANGWQETDLRVGTEPQPIDFFFTAPDFRLFELRTDRSATSAVVSLLPGGGSSSHSPAIAVFQNRQYIAIKGAATSNIYVKSRARGGSFADTTWTQVPGTSPTGPALCVFNNRLYLFVKGGSSNSLFYKSMDTAGQWSGWAQVSGSNTLWRPGLVVFGGQLYCFQSHAVSNRIWYKPMNQAGLWGDWAIVGTGSTNAAPTPLLYDGKVWLFVKGLGGKLLWWCTWTGSSWTAWVSCDGSSEASPGVGMDPTEKMFHLAVRGNLVPRLWHRTLEPGTLAWSDWHLLTNLDPAAQSLDAPTVVPANW